MIYTDDLIPSGVQAIERAIAILEFVAAHPGPVKLVQISHDLDLNRNTVYRLTRALVALDYLEVGDRGYVLGPKPLVLSRSTTIGALLLRKSEPHMQELCDRTHEITNMGIRRRDEVLYLARWETPNPQPGLYIRTGEKAPLYASAMGKVLLAAMSTQWRAVYSKRCSFKKFTDHTIQGADELEKAVESVWRDGFARDVEEVNPGVRCVAVPLKVDDMTVAALSISSPSIRLDQAIEERYVSLLKEASHAISKDLKPYLEDHASLVFATRSQK